MDPVSETRLDLVAPALATLIRRLDVAMHAKGIVFRVTQGIRSWAEQDALYAQGRTAPGAKVTNAKGGESWHNFGMAVDVVPMQAGKPVWDNVADWNRIISEGVRLGMVNGISWNDQPHLQLTGRFGTSPDEEVRQLFKDGGMAAVWKEAGIDV